MSKDGMYRAFKSSDYCRLLVQMAAYSNRHSQYEESDIDAGQKAEWDINKMPKSNSGIWL